MVILKKVKSATLIEALVATVLIVIVFMIASLILNNLVLNTFSKNTHAIENRINELEYEVQNTNIKLPYQEKHNNWEISILEERIETKLIISIHATNTSSKKEIVKQFAVWQKIE